MKSSSLFIFRIEIISGVFRDVFYFPFWWYSIGLWKFIKKTGIFLAEKQKSLALFVWISNIFRPMYGQVDWAGKIISFFVRIFQIIFRSLALIFWLIISLIVIIIWLALPIFVVYQILFQLSLF